MIITVDGGAILLPYIDATISQSEFSLVVTTQNEEEGVISRERVMIRTDGETHFSETLEIVNPPAFGYSGSTGLNIEGAQFIWNKERAYIRLSSSDKWVDVTEVEIDGESF